MKLKSIKEADIGNKKVLLRIDINSPIANGKVLDSPRFRESAETIKYLLKNKARLVIIAHQGRKGDKDFLSLKQHAKIISKYVGREINYVDDLFGSLALNKIRKLDSGEAIILKNVREYDDEINVSKKDNKYISFCKEFDIYVNDAFSACHRKQGSIIIPPRYLLGYIGFGVEKELSALKNFEIKNKTCVYLIGGNKIEDYFAIFNKLKNRKNKLLASGVLANLLLVAKGYNLGYENNWLRENGYLKLIPQLKQVCKKYAKQIILPVDFAFDINGRKEFSVEKAPFRNKIYDVGHETVKLFRKNLMHSRAIFMKGPLGFSEMPMASYATIAILNEISNLSRKRKIFSLLGGGHLTTTISKYKIPDNFSHISLSGGALIAYISGEKLPGLEALKNSR